MSVLLVSITFKMAISLMTGAEMVVTSRRMAAAKSRKVPIWWMTPVECLILTVFVCTSRFALLLLEREREGVQW